MTTVSVTAAIHEPIDVAIARFASSRYGVFSRAEARRFGATDRIIRRRLANGRWGQLSSGVYQLAGVPSSWRQMLFAECLNWGEPSLSSHSAAAALRGLPGFEPTVVEITVPRGRTRKKSDAIVHRAEVAAVDRDVVEAIPVTTVARTLLDIAAVAPAGVVEEALDDALRRKLVSLSRLRWRLGELGGSGRAGVALIRKLLDARGPAAVPQSVFETRLLRALRRADLPRPELQYEIRNGGRLVAVVDFAYPDQKLAIEAEGYRWHSSRMRWQSDLARRNRLTALGWRIVHVTWDDLAKSSEGLRRLVSFAP